jgi:hypothetical protein
VLTAQPTDPLFDDNPFDADYQAARRMKLSLDELERVMRMHRGGVMVPRPDDFFAPPTDEERAESRRFISNPRAEG